MDTLERFELWDDLIDLSAGAYLEPTEEPIHQVRRLAALGRAHFGRGDAESLSALLEDVRQRIGNLEDRKRALEVAAEEAKEIESKKNETKENNTKQPPVEDVAKAETVAKEKPPEAAEKPPENKETEKKDSEKKDTAKDLNERLDRLRPLRKELRVYTLVLRGENAFAGELLEEMKNLNALRRARLLVAIDQAIKAEEVLDELREDAINEVAPTAELVRVLWLQGKTDRAREVFDSLRTIAAHADLHTPPLRRLEEIAHSLGYPEDWRSPAVPATDLGDRPTLDSLGPFRWSPTPAPGWRLARNIAEDVTLEDFRGRPLVLIFYLGAGCLHCVEQLKTTHPWHSNIRDQHVRQLRCQA